MAMPTFTFYDLQKQPYKYADIKNPPYSWFNSVQKLRHQTALVWVRKGNSDILAQRSQDPWLGEMGFECITFRVYFGNAWMSLTSTSHFINWESMFHNNLRAYTVHLKDCTSHFINWESMFHNNLRAYTVHLKDCTSHFINWESMFHNNLRAYTVHLKDCTSHFINWESMFHNNLRAYTVHLKDCTSHFINWESMFHNNLRAYTVHLKDCTSHFINWESMFHNNLRAYTVHLKDCTSHFINWESMFHNNLRAYTVHLKDYPSFRKSVEIECKNNGFVLKVRLGCLTPWQFVLYILCVSFKKEFELGLFVLSSSYSFCILGLWSTSRSKYMCRRGLEVNVFYLFDNKELHYKRDSVSIFWLNNGVKIIWHTFKTVCVPSPIYLIVEKLYDFVRYL